MVRLLHRHDERCDHENPKCFLFHLSSKDLILCLVGLFLVRLHHRYHRHGLESMDLHLRWEGKEVVSCLASCEEELLHLLGILPYRLLSLLPYHLPCLLPCHLPCRLPCHLPCCHPC